MLRCKRAVVSSKIIHSASLCSRRGFEVCSEASSSFTRCVAQFFQLAPTANHQHPPSHQSFLGHLSSFPAFASHCSRDCRCAALPQVALGGYSSVPVGMAFLRPGSCGSWLFANMPVSLRSKVRSAVVVCASFPVFSVTCDSKFHALMVGKKISSRALGPRSQKIPVGFYNRCNW